jgi:Trypsin-like peptidase domain/Tetratricopeptide Repeats-Sensor
MSWSDTFEIQKRLDSALAEYQWRAVSAACSDLIDRIETERVPYPEPAARQVLAALRRKRQFPNAARVAEAFIRFGQNAPRIRRQYAQALIDQGILLASEPVLQQLTVDGGGEVAEARGLLGRLYKQLYVNANDPANSYVRAFLERALSEYLQGYQLAPAQNSWHGINVVALLHRGKADGIDVAGGQDPDALATTLLAALPEASSAEHAFDIATRIEALIALRRTEDAQAAAIAYVAHPETDAFEVASTLRQLEEVWRLTPDTPPGSTILPLLRAARLQREGGSLNTSPSEVQPTIDRVREASKQLEKVFGSDGTVTLEWYAKGLERVKAVARVDRLDGKGHGTGWLVRTDDFFPKGSVPGNPRLLLLTNAHVVNQEGRGGALSPDDARANFQAEKRVLQFEPKVVWSSPSDKLDATFLIVRDLPPDAPSLPIFEGHITLADPPPRLYIIGHPGGRGVELSLQDNVLLGCTDRLLHYRTPTEPGSSGSPVFESLEWRVAALHHAGGLLNRLTGAPPPYEANEGITVSAIKAAAGVLP